jgi:transcriptional regulator with XRE-family HTH domain
MVYMSGFQTVNGKRLQELRQDAMLSQIELAKLAGTTQPTVSNLELGARKAQPRTIRRLAEALGVEPKELVKMIHDEPTEPTEPTEQLEDEESAR